MKQLVSEFTSHLKEAIEIGSNAEFIVPKNGLENILILGLGGSGIGASVISQQLLNSLSLPVVVTKDYDLPEFVSENTLVVACSYSGNTEETLASVAVAIEKKAEICIITSGGKLLDTATSKGFNHIILPSGFPPRAAFGLSFPQLYYAFSKYGLIDLGFESSIRAAIKNIETNEQAIIDKATDVAKNLHGKITVIYCDSGNEAVATRFRQQINENSKMLCWHHALPEMNHNELVGWTTKNDELAVVVLKSSYDNTRTNKRMEFCEEVINPLVSSYSNIEAIGDTKLEQALYLVHLTDWISVVLADLKNIDPVEVNVIAKLKGMLADFNG